MEQLSFEILGKIVLNSMKTLKQLDISFNNGKDLNDAFMLKLGSCKELQSLFLTGCSRISDHWMNQLMNGDPTHNHNQIEGMPKLEVLKLGGLQNIGNNGLNHVANLAVNVQFLELNNLEKLTEMVIENILKNMQNLKIIHLNFTPNVDEKFLQEKQAQYPGVKIIRNINKLTDIKDDGLRMPLPLKSIVEKRPKKKKKK